VHTGEKGRGQNESVRGDGGRAEVHAIGYVGENEASTSALGGRPTR
jgi:hypothetical protein